MLNGIDIPAVRSTAFYSSVAADVWHAQTDAKAYEWWHFDALSDDGREALVIVFTDNYVFSPRYAAAAKSNVVNLSDGRPIAPPRFPAVSFLYSVDGKAVFRTTSEFPSRQFSGKNDSAGCTIGASSFHVDSASYGNGYMVTIDIPLGLNRRLTGSFEWLSIESDLMPADGNGAASSWNMVAPRSDVSGKIEFTGKNGNSKKLVHFRGTGYHDHISGSQAFHRATHSRQWGRAHYVDSTAVFSIQNDVATEAPTAKLLLVRDGKVHERIARCDDRLHRRSKFGIKYPARLSFATDDNIRLRVKAVKLIDSGFYSIRFLSEMTLMLRDGKPRKTIGIMEYMATKNMKYRVFRWFSDLQIGRNGKAPVF